VKLEALEAESTTIIAVLDVKLRPESEGPAADQAPRAMNA
jgi:hypothetical protein